MPLNGRDTLLQTFFRTPLLFLLGAKMFWRGGVFWRRENRRKIKMQFNT
jgi:hypothetical protein